MQFPTPRQITSFTFLVWFIGWRISGFFVKQTKSFGTFRGQLQHLIPVSAGFILIFFTDRHGVIFHRRFENDALEWVGVGLTFAGLLFAVWARISLGRNWSAIVTLKQDHRLIRSGPYRLVRHPIYTGILTGALGAALATTTADAFLGVLLMTIGFLLKIRMEEKVLAPEFGEEFAKYKREVPSLIPFIYGLPRDDIKL